MKPSWDDAPSWAGYLAMDGDGWWNWYEHEPEWHGEPYNMWLLKDEEHTFCQAAPKPDCSGEDWDFAYSTLEPRP